MKKKLYNRKSMTVKDTVKSVGIIKIGNFILIDDFEEYTEGIN